jgi:hypothetical protein
VFAPHVQLAVPAFGPTPSTRLWPVPPAAPTVCSSTDQLLLLLLLSLLQVSRFLSGCGFDFVGARVLTGTEEGLLGWVALNYASGALQVNREQGVG